MKTIYFAIAAACAALVACSKEQKDAPESMPSSQQAELTIGLSQTSKAGGDVSADGLADTAAELKYEHYYGDAVVVKADADCGISGKGEMYLVYWPEDTEFDPYKILQIVQEEIAKYQPADTNGEGQLQEAIKIHQLHNTILIFCSKSRPPNELNVCIIS